ncbi:MAG: glycosyltransferase family 2 protein [Candidatus Omnitrophica bacterium]|nr:glycosyltransferase family 2 protein [Candidatus Omnitrophota bacterium]
MVLKTCVLIPAYQAAQTIRSLVEKIRSQGLDVIVVDDASTDDTFQQARAGGALVLSRSSNGGKGAALRLGIEEVLSRGYQRVIFMDADGQHLPEEIPRFLEAAGAGMADLIVGNRMGHPHGMPLVRRLTNWFMSWLLSRIAKQRIPDTQCGFRLVSRPVLEKIRFSADRFEIESEFIVAAAWAGFRIRSIPVSSVYRRELSFIRPFQDTVRFFRFLRSLKRHPKAT